MEMARVRRSDGPVAVRDSARIAVPVLVEDAAWDKAVPRCRAIAKRAAVAAARAHAGRGPLEISILLTGEKEMRALNRAYRHVDAPTNVLAFASGSAPQAPRATRLLGDVVLALGVVRREAEAQGLELADHLAHLVVHGVLHLLGYDHEAVPDADAMERAEALILAGLGIADPYAGDESEGRCPQRER